MMENIKEIPYGIANFVEVAEQNMYYVDKPCICLCWKNSPGTCSLSVPAASARVSFEYAACVL